MDTLTPLGGPRGRLLLGRVGPLVVLLTVLLPGCSELLNEPVSADGSTLALTYALDPSRTTHSAAAAFGKADRVFLRLAQPESGSVVVEDIVPVTPGATEIRVELQVERAGASQLFELFVEVRLGPDPLFRGEAQLELRVGGTSPAEVSLIPVPANIFLPPPPPPLAALGETLQLQGQVLFATGDGIPGLSLQWESLDPEVAEVTPQGQVTARSEGDARIRGSFGTMSETVVVQVRPVPAAVEVAPPTSNILLGGTVQFSAMVRDAGGTILDRPVTWSSSDSSVASVNQQGLVTGQGVGSAVIRAGVDNLVGEASVRVDALLPAVQTLRAEDIGSSSATLRGEVNPNGSPTQVWFEWGLASNLSDARTTPAQTLSGLNASVEVIQELMDLEPGNTHYFRVVAENAGGRATGSTLSFSTPVDLITFMVGGVVREAVTLRPLPGASVTLVDSETQSTYGTQTAPDGSYQFTGLPSGNYTIQVELTGYHSESASFVLQTDLPNVNVRLRPLPPTVEVEPATSDIRIGGTVRLAATVRHADGTVLDRPVTWSSSNSSVASVNQQGLVTGQGVGTTVIQAAVDNVFGEATIRVDAVLPGVQTLAADDIGPNSATLRGDVDPNGSETQVWFEWGLTSNLSDARTTPVQTLSGIHATARAVQDLIDLESGTTHYFRVVAENAAGQASGSTLSFATPATRVTLTVGGLVSDAVTEQPLPGAQVTLINSQTQATYGALTASDGTYRLSGLPSGSYAMQVTLIGYHSESRNLLVDDDLPNVDVQLRPLPPTVEVEPATSNIPIGGTVQLSATVRDGGGTVLDRPVTWSSSNSSVASVNPQGFVTGLGVGTTVIRAAVDNVVGEATVRVDAVLPGVQTLAADDIGPNSATLRGDVDPNGSETRVWFEWGLTSNLSDARTTPVQTLSGINAPVEAAQDLMDLQSGTLHYFRVVAENAAGQATGSTLSFTTPSDRATFTVGGLIRDAVILEPLPGASVTLIDLETQATYGTRTAVDGTYRFSGLPASDYSMRVEFLGYHTESSSFYVQQDLADINVRLWPVVNRGGWASDPVGDNRAGGPDLLRGGGRTDGRTLFLEVSGQSGNFVPEGVVWLLDMDQNPNTGVDFTGARRVGAEYRVISSRGYRLERWTGRDFQLVADGLSATVRDDGVLRTFTVQLELGLMGPQDAGITLELATLVDTGQGVVIGDHLPDLGEGPIVFGPLR